MIKIVDWVATIPEEDKRLAYVGENEVDTRQFLLTGEDAQTYRDWGFHLDMAFDLSTVTRTDVRHSETTQKSHQEKVTETEVTLDSLTTTETKDVVDVEVDCTATTDVAYLLPKDTEEGLLLTWVICRQHTMLPGKLQATLRAMGPNGQVKKSAIMVFDVEAAVVATPAAEIPLSEFEAMEQRMDALADEVIDAVASAEELIPQISSIQEAAVQVREDAAAAEAAAEKAETKVESLIERNNKHPVSLWVGTKAEYDAITEKDETRLYLISDESLSDYANPHNLLDNSDFTNPVNQRGKTTLVKGSAIESPAYFIDRWCVEGGIYGLGNPEIAYTLTDKGIYVNGDAGIYGGVAQRFAVGYFKQNRNYSLVIHYADGTTEVRYPTDDVLDTGDTRIKIASYNGWDEVFFFVAAGKTISHVALYEGVYTAENIPAYRPKGYATELAECQRYYRNINKGILNGYITSSSTSLWVSLPFSMRSAPKVTAYGTEFTVRTISGYYTGEQNIGAPTSCVYDGGNFGVLSMQWDYGAALGTNNTPASLEIRFGAGIELSADY